MVVMMVIVCTARFNVATHCPNKKIKKKKTSFECQKKNHQIHI